MTKLKWQLKIADRLLKAGSFVQIIDRWQTEGGVFLKVRELESGALDRLRIQAIVNIGGKNYLLCRDLASPADECTVARLTDSNRLCAMDPDRFSSLANALASFVESNEVTPLAEFEKALGALPMVPPER